jgi:hypothetical protein
MPFDMLTRPAPWLPQNPQNERFPHLDPKGSPRQIRELNGAQVRRAASAAVLAATNARRDADDLVLATRQANGGAQDFAPILEAGQSLVDFDRAATARVWSARNGPHEDLLHFRRTLTQLALQAPAHSDIDRKARGLLRSLDAAVGQSSSALQGAAEGVNAARIEARRPRRTVTTTETVTRATTRTTTHTVTHYYPR